jgi:hypothetical protein
MPYVYGDLEYWVGPDSVLDADVLPPSGSGIPTRLSGAGRTLNFGLLAGELLGVYVDDARRVIEAVDALPDTVAHVFVDDDLPILVSTFAQIADALDDAVDASGRPTSDAGGRALAAHQLLQAGADGRLAFRSQHVDVQDLAVELRQLLAFLNWAAAHDLLVRRA